MEAHLRNCKNLGKYKNQLNSRIFKISCIGKLDGVGLVDNTPSTNKIHHIVKKNK